MVRARSTLRVLAGFVLASLVAGCGSRMQVTQLEVVRSIQAYDTLPAGATVLGEVTAISCFRSHSELKTSPIPPIELKAAALYRGAEGITYMRLEPSVDTFKRLPSAVSVSSWVQEKCPLLLISTATAFTLRKD